MKLQCDDGVQSKYVHGKEKECIYDLLTFLWQHFAAMPLHEIGII